jgi:hypothetical protein
MKHTVIFKGVTDGSMYHWENTADESPKQLYSQRYDVLAKIHPKVNQQYVIRYDLLAGNIMYDPYEITEHYTTCSYWKVVGNEFIFKKGKNKGLTITQYTSAFPNNPDEEKSFVKSLTALYRKTNNAYTRNNIIRIFNSGAIKYCEVFGYGGSVIQLGTYKGTDITTVPKSGYIRVYNRLTYFESTIISPITQRNCANWLYYLEHKYFCT